MYAPILEMHLDKVTENARRLHRFCRERGVEVSFVSKGVSGLPEVIRAVRAGGINSFADSRMKNIMAAKAAMPDLRYLLIRIPALDEVDLVDYDRDKATEMKEAVLEKFEAEIMANRA